MRARRRAPAVRLARAGAELVGAAAIMAASRPSAWRRPLGRDASQYMYAGGIVAEGGVPYRDVALNKGPLVFSVYAVVRRLSGTSSIRARAALLPAEALAAPALRAWLASVAPGAAGPGGLALALLMSADAFEGEEPNTEMLATAPCVLAVLAAQRGAAVASGSALAVATLINPALFAALPAVAIGLAADGRWRAPRVSARFASGFAIPLLAALGRLARKGALADARDQILRPAGFNLEQGLEENFRDGRARDHRFLTSVPAPALWAVAGAGCALALADPERRRAAATAGTWSAAMWLRVKLNIYEFPHHYYPALPGLVAALALGADALAARTGIPTWAVAGAMATPLYFSLVLSPQRKALRMKPWERLSAGTGAHAALAYPVAAELRRLSSAEDSVYVCGSEPAILWLAERRAPSRLFDIYASLHHAPYARERKRVLLEHAPAFVCVLPGTEGMDPDLDLIMTHHRYELVWAHEGARILRFAG